MKPSHVRKLRVAALLPLYATGQAISHIALSVCEAMRNPEVAVWLAQPASDPPARKAFTRDAVPPVLKSLAYRLIRSPERINRFCERRYLRWLGGDDVAYLWPGTSASVYEAVVRRGHRLVLESINCHRATAQRILADAYDRLGLPPHHGITDDMIRHECATLALARAVFAPGPLVRQSLLENGVPAERILSSSYGWDRRRLSGTARRFPPLTASRCCLLAWPACGRAFTCCWTPGPGRASAAAW